MIGIKLEYRPCSCKNYDSSSPGSIPAGFVVPESFDSAKAAAFRVKEHKESNKNSWAVHHLGLHVSAAIINNVRYET
jgi:hypothetical protein